MSSINLFLCAAVATIFCSTASAQFSIPKNPFGGSKETESSVGVGEVALASASEFYASALATRLSMNNAEQKFAEAFELSEELELLKLEEQRLGQGSITAGGFKDSMKLSKNIQVAMKTKIDAGYQLSETRKPVYQEGQLSLLGGAAAFVTTIYTGKGWKNRLEQKIESSNPLQKAGALKEMAEAVGVGKELVTAANSLRNFIPLTTSYGETQDITTSQDETKILADLGGAIAGF